MADFDATQAIELSDYDDMTDDEVDEEDKKPVNILVGLIMAFHSMMFHCGNI